MVDDVGSTDGGGVAVAAMEPRPEGRGWSPARYPCRVVMPPQWSPGPRAGDGSGDRDHRVGAVGAAMEPRPEGRGWSR